VKHATSKHPGTHTSNISDHDIDVDDDEDQSNSFEDSIVDMTLGPNRKHQHSS